MNLDLPAPGTTVYTIGHSTRTIEAFIALLIVNGVGLVADVRTIPKSLRNPQLNLDTLPVNLASEEIAYEHMPGLGGLRHPKLGFCQPVLTESQLSGLRGLHADRSL